MGGMCCESSYRDPEIEKAFSIRQLQEIIKNRKQKLPKEISEIKRYIEGEITSVEYFNVQDCSREELQERIYSLVNLEKAYAKIIELLNNYETRLPLDTTKEHLKTICSSYFLVSENTDTISHNVEDFQKFALSYVAE